MTKIIIIKIIKIRVHIKKKNIDFENNLKIRS